MIRRLGRVVRGLALGLAAMAAAGGAGAAEQSAAELLLEPVRNMIAMRKKDRRS